MLDWVLPRRNPLIAMEIETLQESHDLDADNIKFLKTLCDNDSSDQKMFWATAWLLKPLVDWGNHVSNFLHGCPCRKPCVADCPLKGRRAIEMACGRAAKFISSLKKVNVPKEALTLLKGLPPAENSKLLTQWNAAKSCMELRVVQSFSFWQEKPWSLLRMGECLLDDAGELALHRSRAAAKEFLETPSPAKSMTVIEARFLEQSGGEGAGTLRAHVEVFASGGPLQNKLRRELISYGLSLLVLKRLEARHHLVSQRASRGRAASVAAISAELRRVQNRDIFEPLFEDNIDDFLSSIGELTDLPYTSRTDLVQIVTAQVYRGLHDNLEQQAAYFKRFRDHLKATCKEVWGIARSSDYDIKADHLSKLLVQHDFYALPLPVSGNCNIGDIDMIVFQVVVLTPGRRMYVQRAAHMSNDVWQNSIALRIVGTFSADALGADFSHEVDAETSMVEPFHVERFFQGNSIHRLLHFASVEIREEFSEVAIMDALDGSEDSLLVEALHTVGREAVKNDMVLPSGARRGSMQSRAIKWLESADLAANGRLMPTTLSAVTTISSPMPVSNNETAFGRRYVLHQAGWQLSSGRNACAATKTLNQSQCVAYYSLLQCHLESVLVYEQFGAFSHSQGTHYCDTVRCAFLACTPSLDDINTIWQIPLSMTVEFYDKMKQFIQGLTMEDPRLSLKRARDMGPKLCMPKLKRLKGPSRSSSSKKQGHVKEILDDDQDADQGNEQVVMDNTMQADDIHVPAPIRAAVQHCNDMDAPPLVASDPMVRDEDAVPDVILPPLHAPVQVVDANRQQRIQTAVASLEDLARSHHRASTTAQKIIEVLPFLCSSILDLPDKLPADRVEHCMKEIERDGKKFWGAGDTFSRRRTARDVLLLVYHDAAVAALVPSNTA